MRVLAARLGALPRGSQKRIAQLAGLNEASLSRWKSEQGNPRLSELEALADAMAVSVTYLIDEKNTERPTLPKFEPDAERIASRIDRMRRRAERAAKELQEALKASEQAQRKR